MGSDAQQQQLSNVPVKKNISFKNLGIGAVIQVFEVSTLGQPFEVLKTHLAGLNLIMASTSKGFHCDGI